MKPLFILLCLCWALGLSAQDQLFKRDNSKLEVKILEITPAEVKYKLFTYQEGPTISIARNDVVLIIYQNGQHEVFETVSTPTVQATEPADYVAYQQTLQRLRAVERLENARELKEKMDSLTVTKNLVFLNVTEFANGGVGIGYMREFFQNRFDITVQGAVGFTKPGFTDEFDSKNYGTGSFDYERKAIDVTAGLNVHTTNMRPITHFIGPMFSFSQFNGHFNDGYAYNPLTGRHPFVLNRYSFYLNNGILFRITRHLNMAMNMAVGFSRQEFVSSTKPKYFSQYDNSRSIVNFMRTGFYLGYRF